MEKVNNEKTGTRQGRNGWSRRPQRGTSGDRRRAYTYTTLYNWQGPWLYVLQRTSDNYKLYYKWWLKEGEDMIYKDVFFVINFYEN